MHRAEKTQLPELCPSLAESLTCPAGRERLRASAEAAQAGEVVQEEPAAEQAADAGLQRNLAESWTAAPCRNDKA
jgi:hypothetical protein